MFFSLGLSVPFLSNLLHTPVNSIARGCNSARVSNGKVLSFVIHTYIRERIQTQVTNVIEEKICEKFSRRRSRRRRKNTELVMREGCLFIFGRIIRTRILFQRSRPIIFVHCRKTFFFSFRNSICLVDMFHVN